MPPTSSCDVGYSRVGFWVQISIGRIERLAALVRLRSRHRSVRRAASGLRAQSEGVFIEVMEDDPLRGVPVMRGRTAGAARSVTLSVPDLEKSKRFFMGALGMPESTAALRRPEHEALWGWAAHDPQRRARRGNVLVELVHYVDPVGKPWPEGHRISDQGILNIAFATAGCAR